MNTPIRTLAVAAAMAICAQLAACGDSGALEPNELRKPVIVTTVRQGPLSEQRSFTATVRARVETDVGFRTAGKVIQRLVDVGDIVKAGQPLARLDVSDHALGVQAALDQLRAATVEAQQAASDEARMGRLLNEGSVGVADHERQKARADAAAALLDQARRNHELARNRASYTTLVAPYAGVVTGLRMEIGQVVGEGQPVVSMAREGEREIVADLPEGLIGRVRELRATATLWQGTGAPLSLRLREVSPAASGTSGTFRVRYAVVAAGEQPRSLTLGATARLQLEDDSGQGVVLPASALVKFQGAAGVWVIEGASSLINFVPVQVQSFETDTVRVSGLADGLRVVTVGAQKLDPSMKVTPVERRNTADVARPAGAGKAS
jgi:RND family efflux transporter MFP subunit